MIRNENAGYCGVRLNTSGIFELSTYGYLSTAHVDMIEKKPIYHYRPGSKLLSLGTVGCNWSCDFCINHHISQSRRNKGKFHSPENIVELAKHYHCDGIAFSYNEPLTYLEFAKEIGSLAHKAGLFNVVVTNGYGTPEAAGMVAEFVDCIAFGLKGNGSGDFLRKHSNVPDPKPILDTILQLKKRTKIHMEISNLILPHEENSLQETTALCDWIFHELGPNTPIHFISFQPSYKLDSSPTTSQELLEAHCTAAANAGLLYAYIANFPGHERENTYCPSCSKMVVRRLAYNIIRWDLDEDNRCPECGYKIQINGKYVRTPRNEQYEAVIFPPYDYQYLCEGLVPPSPGQSDIRFEPE
jgi:pyruvate formate lyase activating enzyme